MTENRTLTMLVTVTAPKELSASAVRREVRHLINEGTGWSYSAGEAVKVRSVAADRLRDSA
jgi:hypothetical protein